MLEQSGVPNGMGQTPWASMLKLGRKPIRSNLALDTNVEPEDPVVLVVVHMETLEVPEVRELRNS